MRRQCTSRLHNHGHDLCTGADQSVVILSLAILDPAPAGGVVKLALVLATLLLAAEDEGAVLFFGVAKAEAMPDTALVDTFADV